MASVFSLGCVAFAKQHYAIRGKLMCGDAPASNVHVMMYDEDTGSRDEEIATGRTAADGSFSIQGEINHSCK